MKFFSNQKVFENNPAVQNPKIKDDFQILTESVENNLEITPNILKSFNIQDSLNPEIWNNDKLNPEVRKNLLKIAIDLVQELKQPEIKIKDVLFVGSLANYNWSKYSDIDLHILIDFSKFKEDENFIKAFFDAQKEVYNKSHDIMIHDFPVEIYFQGIDEKLEASAIYSLKSDKWLQQPQRENKSIDIPSVKRKAMRILDQMKDIQQDYNNEEWQKVIQKTEVLRKSLKAKRQAGLENGGEYSTENLVYKVLRRTDAIDTLWDLKNGAYDHLMSIPEGTTEGLNEGVNEADKVIPYDERPELRAAAKNGVDNKTPITDEQLYKVMGDCSMAKKAAIAYRAAFEKGEPTFTVSYMGRQHTGKIPEGFRADPNNLHYFDVAEMGDGGFQYKLYKNGRLEGMQIKSRPDMNVNPNMHAATDPGYNKDFEDRIKYFTVKAGFQGKYRDAMVYSIFDSPATDGSIKVRIINYPEIIDFLTKDKGHMQYTADEKGTELANQMDFKKKLEKVRKDAEAIIGRPLSSNQKWMEFKANLEKQGIADIDQETKNFVDMFKSGAQPVGKSQVSLPSDEKSDWDKEQAAKAARLQAFKDRKATKK